MVLIKMITINGPRILSSVFQYCGANDQAGPNYKDQSVVNSYYTLSD